MLGWLTATPPNPVLLTLGPVHLRWYGLLLAIALLAGVAVAIRLGKRSGMSQDEIVDMAFVTSISAIIGARLVHVFNDWDYYSAHWTDIPQLWKGGLAFHGVLLGGLLALWFFAKRRKRSILLICDAVFPALALGQVIGRLGNWFNQELYGRPTDVPWAIPIDPAYRVAGYETFTTFHPLFAYEMLGNAIVLALLLLLWRWPKRHIGDVAVAYLILSPALRFALDSLRIGQPMIGPITNAQLFSILLIMAGLALVFTRARRPLHY